MMKMGRFQTRSMDDYSVTDDGHLLGVPIKFNSPEVIHTQTGDFEEVIERGAITDDLLKDVVLFVNHDKSRIPLARTRTGGLKLEIKDDGVHMDAKLNLERSDCKDAYLAVKDGTISGMSFGFRVADDEWTELRSAVPKRKIKKMRSLHDVSVVTNPAYTSTSVYARSDEALDSDSKALDEARAQEERDADAELELLKIKALAISNI